MSEKDKRQRKTKQHEGARIVLECLQKYYCLTKEQLVRYLYDFERVDASQIINNLKFAKKIFIDEGDYCTLDLVSSSDENRLLAFWVLLKFIDKCGYKNHYPVSFPSEIGFLFENKLYEIVVIPPGNEMVLEQLKTYKRNSSNDDEDRTNYIFVIGNKNQIPIIEKRIGNLFGVIALPSYNPNTNSQDVQFAKIESSSVNE